MLSRVSKVISSSISHRRAASAALAAVVLLTATACSEGPASGRPLPVELPPEAREAARKLPFDGAHNFRELGGYRTADGGQTRWGVLYRSDALSKLSDDDQDFLQRLGVRQVIDFRSDSEREEAPDRIPPDAGISYRPVPVLVDGAAVDQLTRKIRSGDLADTDFRAMLTEGNRHLVTDFRGAYADFLRRLADPAGLPAVFHCTAGKDRAGFGAALALLAAGVPRETVIEDFLKTNDYTAREIRKRTWLIQAVSFFRVDPEQVRPLLGVERGYIEAALETIDREYGGVDRYLREGLGLDEATLAALRRNLVEPAGGA